jgi:hypothetical protein
MTVFANPFTPSSALSQLRQGELCLSSAKGELCLSSAKAAESSASERGCV